MMSDDEARLAPFSVKNGPDKGKESKESMAEQRPRPSKLYQLIGCLRRHPIPLPAEGTFSNRSNSSRSITALLTRAEGSSTTTAAAEEVTEAIVYAAFASGIVPTAGRFLQRYTLMATVSGCMSHLLR